MAKKKPTRRFNSQSYLIYDLFVKNKRKKDHKGKSNIGQSKLEGSINVYKISGDYTPVTFISKLNRSKKLNVYKHILDLETHKMSSLVPDISLYRVKDEFYEPFYFPISAEAVTTESLLAPGSGVGGVGIKSFSANFTGNNPFSFDKQISCTLEVYVDNLENIFKSPPPGYAKLADLFTISNRGYVSMKDGLSQEVSSEKLFRPSNYEVSVRMGYSVSPHTGLLTAEERTAIQNTGLSMRLTINDHTISVQQDGTAVISITYTGRLEGILKDGSLSLLKDPEDLVLMAGYLTESANSRSINNMSKEEKEVIESRQRVETKNRMRKYFAYLSHEITDSTQDRLHRIRISGTDIEAYKNYQTSKSIEEAMSSAAQLDIATFAESGGQSPPTNSKPDSTEDNLMDFTAEQAAADPDGFPTALDLAKEYHESQAAAAAEKSKSIHYVFVGDMLESMAYNVKKNIADAITHAQEKQRREGKDMSKPIEALQKSANLLKNIKILLGEIPVRISKTEVRKINLADVPVSMEIFTKYFFDEIEQQSKTTLSVKKFLDDIATRIIRKALSGHNDVESPFLASNVQIRTLNITGPTTKKLSSSKVEVDIDDLPEFIRRTSPKKKSDEAEYYIIYAETTETDTSGLNGDLREDIKNGIYHFHVGKNRGMLKSIGFSKLDIKGKKEALMLGSVSLYDELKMPYTARISMFGNGLFLPGAMVYVNPASIGFGDPRNKRSAAARLGLGGYYQILSVNTSFDGSAMTTELETSYTSWADNDSSLLSELTPHLESRVDQVPARTTNTDTEGAQAPLTSFEKVSDFQTLLSSDLLTKPEKDAIVQLELGAKPVQDDPIARESQAQGRRGYVTQRSGGNVRVEITDDNQISIARVRM